MPPAAAAALVLGSLAIAGAVSRRYSPDPSHPGIFGWYKRLRKPPETPPDPVFGAVWPVLLSGLGYGAYRLLRAPPAPVQRAALGLGGATLGLVTLYSKIAFGDRNLTAGARESGVLAGTAAAYVGAASRIDRIAALVGVPLALWSLFGAVLTKRIAARNPERDRGQPA